MLRYIFPFLLIAVQAEEVLPYTSSTGLYISYIVKAFIFIILLLAFMYYWYRHLLPKMQSQGSSNLFVREKLVLEPGTALYVLDIKGEYKLLVVSNKNSACYDLSAKNLQYQPAVKKDFAAYLAEIMKSKDNKKGRKNVKK